MKNMIDHLRCLSNGVGPVSFGAMRRCLRTGILAFPAALVSADVVELKDEASMKGRVIAEKSEHVAVDVGYTILTIPRSASTKITTPKDEETAAEEKKGENTTPPASAQMAGSTYQNPGA